jgi:hypothetical protein
MDPPIITRRRHGVADTVVGVALDDDIGADVE